jgi:hypothetical protein
MSKLVSQKQIKKELIKIINGTHIDEIVYEPRWIQGYEEHYLIGSVITIRTSHEK